MTIEPAGFGLGGYASVENVHAPVAGEFILKPWKSRTKLTRQHRGPPKGPEFA
jgi:hypothetical protein